MDVDQNGVDANNLSDVLYCVARQIERDDELLAARKLLAQAYESESVKPTTNIAIRRVEKLEQDAFALFRQALHFYRPNQIMVSFNGGKDCTVLLHMLHTFFTRNKCLSHLRIPVLYIETPNSFDEIEPVVQECERRYNITLLRRQGCIKEVLEQLLEEFPDIKAVFMGSRRTDPHCENLTVMQATDPGWPNIMRIMPMLDWQYIDVWYYIFVRCVPYCSLYERGYTSLGQKNNTIPNPQLLVVCPFTGLSRYKHAAELRHPRDERAGRYRVVDQKESDSREKRVKLGVETC